MRNVIIFFVLAIFLSDCSKDICSKCFMKDKSSKAQSTAFASISLVQTKLQVLFIEANRTLYFQFKKSPTDSTINKTLVVRQSTETGGMSFKRAFVLGTQFSLALIFEDSSQYIVKFTSNEEAEMAGTINRSSNKCPIDATLDGKLRDNKIVSAEIMNPFGADNETKVKQWDVTNGERIKAVYNCFLNK